MSNYSLIIVLPTYKYLIYQSESKVVKVYYHLTADIEQIMKRKKKSMKRNESAKSLLRKNERETEKIE